MQALTGGQGPHASRLIRRSSHGDLRIGRDGNFPHAVCVSGKHERLLCIRGTSASVGTSGDPASAYRGGEPGIQHEDSALEATGDDPASVRRYGDAEDVRTTWPCPNRIFADVHVAV